MTVFGIKERKEFSIMKKIFVIADHLWGTVTIRIVTDKDIILNVIKRRLEDFVDNMDGFDRETEEIVNTVLHMETLPKYFFWVMKEHDNEYADAQSIFLKVENGRVTFKAERDENNISTAIETCCLCEFMEEE